MTGAPGNPWDGLAVPPEDPRATVRRLAEALERERILRNRTEVLLEEQTRELYFANERLAAQHARLLAAERAERSRLQSELALAKRIQAALLPREVNLRGLQIAGDTDPCAELGGDYYDVRPTDDGCWMGIGDVSGHGVTAGLVMLMMQATAAALTRLHLFKSPSEVLARLNEVLYENIRRRMAGDEHITAALLRLHDDGRITFAGAHEELLVFRARTGACERVQTSGTWLGVVPDIRRVTHDQQIWLEPGDCLALYTDGLTEATNDAGQQFGVERVCAEIERLGAATPREIVRALLARVREFAPTPSDDITAVVARYLAR